MRHHAEKLLSEAKALEEAGIQLLVLECVPSSLGKAVSEALTIAQAKIPTVKFW